MEIPLQITARDIDLTDAIRTDITEKAAKLDEKLNAATESVMKEAQQLQDRVDERMGKEIRASIVFEAARITIADKGETIGREHQTRLNKAVKAKLAELEAKNAEERQKSLAKLEDAQRPLGATNFRLRNTDCEFCAQQAPAGSRRYSMPARMPALHAHSQECRLPGGIRERRPLAGKMLREKTTIQQLSTAESGAKQLFAGRGR